MIFFPYVKNIKKKDTFAAKKKRALLIYSFVICIIIALLLRLTWVQIHDFEFLIHQSNIRSSRIQLISTRRGNIIDRNNNLLAITFQVYNIFADPKFLLKYNDIKNDQKIKKLSYIINLPLSELLNLIYKHRNKRFFYLKKDINKKTSIAIKKLNILGIKIQEKSRRYYPYNKITSHVVGFADDNGQGLEGIEKSLNTLLSGKHGKKIVYKDPYNQVFEEKILTKNIPSQDIQLSIDQNLQKIMYEKLDMAISSSKAKSGSAVLIKIDTGEILAMANIPSYNPNNINEAKKDAIRNRAITDIFEPGSTIKPIVIMAALQQGTIKENSIINTLPFNIGKHTIKDVKTYQQLNIIDILKKSSNVAISKIALKMPISKVIDTYSKFGIGKITNIGMIGENKGFNPINKKKWSKLEIATFSFGYGLMLTPLQLAQTFSIIGNHGCFKPLSIIKVNHQVLGKQVFPQKYVDIVLKMMEKVSLPGGSGFQAATKDYRIAIKTGTVKKINKKKRYVNKYIAYAAGVAPVSNPYLALAIVIDEPTSEKYYGGLVSAPIFGQIMQRSLEILNIKPDIF
ncbi:penicillin-binding transpeptidase domain-containing protein [Candidatus Tachikawaea gelatinosa]|uniref:Peptidoglycan glycosyltransferase n=1 Tax=Candidatus Tachikawaea gelatinosa TaxID=1410383 RepID=A0A090ARN7_9ENTR|nr:penicillin-binding transpeptidase domain-containing protein [Candidatus Tachikawaea gelatinosa]BAP58465.1 peptidoglycan glycosyltransferase [Candidatus Tachikawaea gelatinosa]